MQWENLLFGPIGALFFDFSTDCKTGCEPGETTVATDGWGCRSGTYSYYCCADPNKPAAPDLPDVKICYGPSHLDSLKSDLEPESNLPNVYDEEEEFDFTCGTTGTTRLLMLSETSQNDNSTDNVFLAREPTADELAALEIRDLLEGRDLFPRGARERVAMALCGPQGQRSSIWVQQYPGASSIILTTGRAWTVAKQGLCAAAGVSGLSTLAKGTDWVTEHVLEKQEFRNALEYMAAGETPSGKALRAGAVPFNQVFGSAGIFQDNWPSSTFTSLSFTHSWVGNINDFFTGLLGRTTDQGLTNRFIENLQVADRDFNVYKEFVVAGKDFVSQNLWSQYNPQERVGILLDVVDMHGYRGTSDVVASYASTFKNMATLFGDLAKYATSKGITYDFKDAWEQIMPDYLNYQVDVARQTFQSYLNDEIVYWGSSLAKLSYSPLVVKEMGDLLLDLKNNMNTHLSLPVSQMTS